VAEEGTNTLYLGLVDLIATRDTQALPYTLTEVEMLLNHFPHSLWQEVGSGNIGQDIVQMRERFYYPILQTVQNRWSEMKNDQFLATFQGLTLAGPRVLGPKMLNEVLNSVESRLRKKELTEFDQVIAFFELFLRHQEATKQSKEIRQVEIDTGALLDFANQLFFKEHL